MEKKGLEHIQRGNHDNILLYERRVGEIPNMTVNFAYKDRRIFEKN